MSGDFSLYIHCPFCTKKCHYCHFFVIPDRADLRLQYLEALKGELHQRLPLAQGLTLASIYFGGGTPSLLGAAVIAELLQIIFSYNFRLDPALEITLEANPDQWNRSLATAYRQAGINRLSLGVQSLDDAQLTLLTRRHNAQQAIQSVLESAAAGFTNISIDLMDELPFQTTASWQRSLEQAAQLPITHLSLYNLTFEPHTPFHRRKDLQAAVPDEQTCLHFYTTAIETLGAAGLQQYEISAFAKPGYPSKHNTGYWQGRPFLGLGPSAYSDWEGQRLRNVAHLEKYRSAIATNQPATDFAESLQGEARRRERLIVQLRLREGVDLEAFTGRYGSFETETLTTLDKLISLQLIEQHANRLRLTERGVLLYDSVATELV